MTTEFKVDLTNCEREPIHIPGKVQAHGFLIALSADNVIRYASENTAQFIGVSAADLLDKPVTVLSGYLSEQGNTDFIPQLLQLGRHSNSFDAINPYQVTLNGAPYNLIINLSDPHCLLEFEPALSDLNLDLQRTIGRSVSEMLSGRYLQELLNNAARQVKTIIQYDRVMIYKFLDDGHGHVISEAMNDDLEPFLDLHYPASDIPRQARELYKLNLTRIITDVNTEPSPIITPAGPDGSAQPLDLTHSALRAVSPIHIQYLKNMGVASSFSISLMYRNELWGLIACHNYSPRFIDFKAREASKLIGQIISSALEYKQDEESVEIADQYQQVFAALSSNLRKGGDITDALTRHSPSLLKATQATGAALLFEDNVNLLGLTPDADQVRELGNWLKGQLYDKIYYTHNLAAMYPQAKAFSRQASGVLACSLSREMDEMVIWFKPEQISTIKWAGNPDKPAEPGPDGVMQLSPRRSFDVWAQNVQHTSDRWTKAEITSVVRLREEIVYAVNRQANEIRILNEKLKQAYEELDTFSFTVSHDLRTPLSTIRNYSELLQETNQHLDADSKRILDKIIGGADRMNMLIKEVLNYSQVGRAVTEFTQIDMSRLLSDIKHDLIVAMRADGLNFSTGETPDVYGDPTMVTQIFTNLLNNAIKYSSRSAQPQVSVSGTVNYNEVVYRIQDNGIGVDVNYFNRIFDLFKRMDNVRDYEGTGVGLAIVKRMVEKHNGRIWLESELGVGTIFYVAFPNNTYAED